MVAPHRSKEVLELGRRLVAQLERDDDFLTVWMAHYVAELIDNVEKATPASRPAAQETCAKAILEFWRRQSDWPKSARPFVKLEPILGVLASLDDRQAVGRYVPREQHEALARADEAARSWLSLAINVDNAARFLIRTALGAAAEPGLKAMSPWAALARNAELLRSVERSVLDYFVKAKESGDAAQLREASVRLSLAQIEAFLDSGAQFAEVLRAQLENIDTSGAKKKKTGKRASAKAPRKRKKSSP